MHGLRATSIFGFFESGQVQKTICLNCGNCQPKYLKSKHNTREEIERQLQRNMFCAGFQNDSLHFMIEALMKMKKPSKCTNFPVSISRSYVLLFLLYSIFFAHFSNNYMLSFVLILFKLF